MDLASKVERAKALISEHVSNAVVLSSFGKDSMVLLDLIKSTGVKLPIISYREPFFPEKYAFADRVISENQYSVVDYPPLSTQLLKKNGHFEILNFYQITPEGEYVALPTGVNEPQPGEDFLCGLVDLLLKPCGSFSSPWTTVFVGHKASDVDPLHGPIPLEKDTVTTPGLTVVFPIRDFTDADIWEYHRLYNVPVHEERYDRSSGFREFASKQANPDYFPACMRCLDPDNPEVVTCPMLGCPVGNQSSKFQFSDGQLPPYIKKGSE